MDQEGERVAKLPTRTGRLKWDEKTAQKSKKIYLSSCMLYLLEGFSRETYRRGHLSVVLEFPHNARSFERPLAGNRTTWILPGERKLTFKIQNDIKGITVTFGSTLHINATYKLCCVGMWCPECSMQLKIYVIGHDYMIDNSLETNCAKKQFNISIPVTVQPGRYNMEVHWFFMNESTVTRRSLGYITVNESFVEECSFESALGLCPKWNSQSGGKWKFSSRNNLSDHDGYFAYTGDSPYIVTLETPLISAGDSVRLCLTFRYSMRGQPGSSLNVSLKSVHDESEILIYNLVGYHGDTWLEAQVSWTETEDSKIVFRGFTNSVDEFAIGIDDVKIFTSNCEVYPVFSSPGYQCSNDEFACDNGQCVASSLRCDGDMACLDNSDEQNCACLSDEFNCGSGTCVDVTKLCDDIKDCPEGSDETNCEKPCSEFQCADGTCIPWSSTCRVSVNWCPDFTHFPTVCGLANCPLNNLKQCSPRDAATSEPGSFRHCEQCAIAASGR